jgi:hypothetical protein
MRTLIDGYNVMYAAGLLGHRLGRDGLRKVRRRFLNDVADSLESVAAHLTTIVFDARNAPESVPETTTHKGLNVIFSVHEEDADSRIEQLIARHSSPKQLTVVSSDHRIREAARRRKAQPLTAEAFLEDLDRRKRQRRRVVEPSEPPNLSKIPEAIQDDRAYWLTQFAHLDDDPTLVEVRRPPDFLPSDEDLARIAKEVAQEGAWPRRRRS